MAIKGEKYHRKNSQKTHILKVIKRLNRETTYFNKVFLDPLIIYCLNLKADKDYKFMFARRKDNYF